MEIFQDSNKYGVFKSLELNLMRVVYLLKICKISEIIFDVICSVHLYSIICRERERERERESYHFTIYYYIVFVLECLSKLLFGIHFLIIMT